MSNQIKSNQIKSNSIIFAVLLSILLVSCADITNYKNSVSLNFAPNFSQSRLAAPNLEDDTHVNCVAKLYTHGTNVDILVQSQNFSGTWKEFVNDFQFRFSDANVWCKGYVKVTIAYTYSIATPIATEQKNIILQGKSDTETFVRGNNLIDIQLEHAPSTKYALFKNSNSASEFNLVSEETILSSASTIDGNTTDSELKTMSSSTRFCFDDNGIIYALAKNSSDGSYTLKGFTSDINILQGTPSAIKSGDSYIWVRALNSSNSYESLTCYQDGRQKATIVINNNIIKGSIINSAAFAVHKGYAYIAVAPEGIELTFHIVRLALNMRVNDRRDLEMNPRESGYVDISPAKFGIDMYTLRDMHIQQGKLYILAENVSSTSDKTESRGGVIQIPLSHFEKGINDVEPWPTGERVFGWYKDGTVPAISIANRYFYGPVRFIARKPDELVIADDGIYREEKELASKKRIVIMDLDTLSMNCIDVASTGGYYLWLGAQISVWNLENRNIYD